MALVRRRQHGGERDLLAAVGGVDIHFLVVNANAAVRVAGRDGDLHRGGDGDRRDGGDVEGEDSDVLEDEARLGRAEDGPYEEDHDSDEEDDGEDGAGYAAVETVTIAMVVVVVAVLYRHCKERDSGLKGSCKNKSLGNFVGLVFFLASQTR